MANLTLYTYMKIDNLGLGVTEPRVAGSLTSAIATRTVTVVQDKVHALADDVPEKLWAGADGDPPDFDFLWLEASGNIELQLTIDAGTTDEFFVMTVGANSPFILTRDDALHTNSAIDLLDGTANVIDEIWAQGDGTTPTVRLILAT